MVLSRRHSSASRYRTSARRRTGAHEQLCGQQSGRNAPTLSVKCTDLPPRRFPANPGETNTVMKMKQSWHCAFSLKMSALNWNTLTAIQPQLTSTCVKGIAHPKIIFYPFTTTTIILEFDGLKELWTKSKTCLHRVPAVSSKCPEYPAVQFVWIFWLEKWCKCHYFERNWTAWMTPQQQYGDMFSSVVGFLDYVATVFVRRVEFFPVMKLQNSYLN